MNIFVCGNPLVEEDALPLRLLPELRKGFPSIDFIEFEPTEDFPHQKDLIIIDTVINAKDVVVIEDIDSFCDPKSISLHDFDLGTNLKLAKKMKWIDKVKIIGVPPKMKEKEAIEKISSILKSLKN